LLPLAWLSSGLSGLRFNELSYMIKFNLLYYMVKLESKDTATYLHFQPHPTTDAAIEVDGKDRHHPLSVFRQP
jgi:hypothetical protein